MVRELMKICVNHLEYLRTGEEDPLMRFGKRYDGCLTGESLAICIKGC